VYGEPFLFDPGECVLSCVVGGSGYWFFWLVNAPRLLAASRKKNCFVVYKVYSKMR
jgi:hypothetical protein